jgi:hypothetical protein
MFIASQCVCSFILYIIFFPLRLGKKFSVCLEPQSEKQLKETKKSGIYIFFFVVYEFVKSYSFSDFSESDETDVHKISFLFRLLCKAVICVKCDKLKMCYRALDS